MVRLFKRRKKCAAYGCMMRRMWGKDIRGHEREFCRSHTALVEAWYGFHMSAHSLKEMPPPPRRTLPPPAPMRSA